MFYLMTLRSRQRREFFINEVRNMADTLFPSSTGALSDAHHRFAPKPYDAFQTFSRRVFANGALATKTKQLIAVAVAHVTQCPYCIRGHTKAAMREGATPEELMEAIWVAAEMRAGGSYGTWSETPAMLPMKPFTIFDASITLSLSDVSDAGHY